MREWTGVSEVGNYAVDANSLINDQRIWRVLYKGYGFNSATEMGLDCDEDAYLVTRFAIYSILKDYDIDSKYRATDETGEKMIQVLKELVEYGRYGGTTYKEPYLEIEKSGEIFEKEISNQKYQMQKFILNKNCTVINYEIIVEGLTDGTIVLDENFIARDKITTNSFYIAIPNNEFQNNYTAKIEMKNANVKTYPVILGASYDPNLQNYALVSNPYEIRTAILNEEFVKKSSSIKIIKKDSETEIPIENVKFKLRYENGTEIGEFITNSEGIINVENINKGKIIIQEIETKEEYILNNEEIVIELGYNENKTIEIDNKRKKGGLKIIKIDKDDKNKTLEGVEFDLIYSDGTVIKLKTNEKGEINLEGLNTDNCILKETKTNKEYNLTGEIEIKIEWDKTTEVIVENEKKKGQVEILKVDSKDRNLKLEDVTFEILDKDKQLIEIVTTNKEGIAISSKIPIGTIYIKEIETKEGYILNSEIIEIEIQENKVITIKIENEKIPEPEPPEEKPEIIIEEPIIEKPIKEIPKLPKTGM